MPGQWIYIDENIRKVKEVRRMTNCIQWFVEQIVIGEYPESMTTNVGECLPNFTEKEEKIVKGSYDFLGTNYYTATYAANDPTKPTTDNYLTDSHVSPSSSTSASHLYVSSSQPRVGSVLAIQFLHPSTVPVSPPCRRLRAIDQLLRLCNLLQKTRYQSLSFVNIPTKLVITFLGYYPSLISLNGEEDASGRSKQSRGEKKSHKAMLKLGMKPIPGVSRVTVKKSKNGSLFTGFDSYFLVDFFECPGL
ncbi:unnamed protein product [Fraxinus pennsylvanica]|uniref:Nascent polypeptide-associated complex subunit beta n=1 Tax=Fraxinus pennsylvanica TaxID=56036 RepID=A0AAD1Z3M4_9LAMI|nr:unnamed protein product [Fraxinus pennsylvanica]